MKASSESEPKCSTLATLRAEDLADTWAYERSHKKEVDSQIKANEEA